MADGGATEEIAALCARTEAAHKASANARTALAVVVLTMWSMEPPREYSSLTSNG
jgi:hypothetical protein